MKTIYYFLILCTFFLADSSGVYSQTIYSWGANHLGQIGDGTTISRNVPTKILTGYTWRKIVTGSFTTFAIREDSTLWAWGGNPNFPILGNGFVDTTSTVPIQTAVFGKWIDVSCYHAHVLAIRSDSTLWAWGQGLNGELGDGNSQNNYIPSQIGTDNDWAVVSTGPYSSAAIKRDGSLWVWGGTNLGPFGLGPVIFNTSVPTRLGTQKEWMKIFSGQYSNFAIKTNGTLWGWGNNYTLSGPIGVGTNESIYEPTQIGKDSDWVDISTLYSNVLAIKTDRSLWAWGVNDFGQSGNGTTINQDIPIKIGNDKWKSIDVGGFHSAGIRADGTLWTWGLNNIGQLGNGTNINSLIPIQVETNRNWESVFCGQAYTIALRGVNPIISATTQQYPPLICESEKYFSINIKNTGEDTLEISNLSFTGTNMNEFEFEEVLPIIIAPGGTLEVTFKFHPASPGEKTVEAVIESNATNSPIYRIPVVTKQESIDFSYSKSEIDFGNMFVNEQANQSFTLTNTSTISTSFKLTSSPNMTVVPDEIMLAPNASSLITVTYLGSSTEIEIQGLVSIVETTCKKSFAINTKGSVLANIPMLTGMMKASSLSGFPGDEVELTITFENAKNLVESGVTGFSAELKYNPTLLFNSNYAQSWIDDKTSMIHLTNLPAQSGELTKVKFIVGLGNAETSDLVLTNISAIGGKADIQTEKGIFTLLGICREGGTRLINSRKRAGITQLLPNPVVNNLDISLEIIEIGETKLELYNIFGEKVKTILNENATNIGSRELSINLNELGSGQYMLIFTSPTIRGMEKVVVVR